MLLAAATAAHAAPPGPGTAPVSPPTGGFAIDGNVQANVPTAGIGDWVPGAAGAGGSVLNGTTSGTPLVPATTSHLIDLFNSGADDNFAGGKKFDDNPTTWTWVVNTVNDKTDIHNALLHFTRDANAHEWAVFGADRLSNNGDAYIDFEFLQNTVKTTGSIATGGGGFTSDGPNGGRTVNDFIITLSLTKGGTTAGFGFSRWESIGGGLFDYVDRTSIVPAGAAYAAVNTAVVPASYLPFGKPSYDVNNFVEGAVDLTALLAAVDPCLSLGVKTILIKTKVAASPTATITDFIAPIQVVRQLGVADAGIDQKICSQGASTTFTVTGTATPAPGDVVSSTLWSVVPGTGTATIDSPTALTTDVHVTSDSVALRFTVKTSPHNCTTSDDVVLKVTPAPAVSITGDDPICPGAQSVTYTGPPGMSSYAWTISGDASITSVTNQQSVTVKANVVCDGSFTLSLSTSNGTCPSQGSKKVSLVDKSAPTIGSPGVDATIQCPTSPTFTPPTTASDGCDPSPQIIEVGDVKTPGACAGTYDETKTWKSKDACGNLSEPVSQTIHVIDTTAPTVGAPGEDATIQCPTTPSFTPPTTAHDDCDQSPQIVEISDVKTPGSCAGAYDETKTWKAKDACGNLSAPVSQTIHVIDTTPPTIGAPGADQTIACTSTPAFTPPTAHDDCDASPQIIEVSDVKTPGACAGKYDETKTWKAKDACGNLSAPVSQTIHVVDTTPPAIGSPGADATVQCPTAPVFTAPTTATDACDPSPQIIEISDVKTPGSCAGKYDETKTWKAKDACGNLSAPVSQTIHVIDTTPPTIGAPGADATIQCPSTPSFSPPTTAHDDCDASPQIIEISDVKTPGSCAGKYDETKTWKAKDACGNLSAPVSQTIHVTDTTPPTLGAAGADKTIQCPTAPVFTPPTAHDDCDPSPQVLEIGDVKTPGSCAGKYDETKTWQAKDACGNLSGSVSQTIHVIDTTAPTIGAAGPDATIQCPATPTFTAPTTAHDDCDGAPQIVEVSDVKTPGSCAGKYDETKTWKAKDACGNLSEPVSQTIHVVDTTPPVVTCPGDITRPSCQSKVTWTSSALDNCGGVLPATCDPPSGTIFPVGETTVTCSAMDACGNKGTCTFKVTILPSETCSITGGDQPLCEGQTTTLCGPDGNNSWSWKGPGDFTATTRCITVGVDGTYTLQTTNLATNCKSQCSKKLVVNPLPPCVIGGVTAILPGGSTTLCGPMGNYTYQWSTGATTQCIKVSTAGPYSLTVTDKTSHCTQSCSVTVNTLTCACTLAYPDSSNLPRSLVDFSESEVLRTFDPGAQQCVSNDGTIRLWYNDEHALTLGVRQVVVKTAQGTTTTNYIVSPTPTTPTCIDHPAVGTMASDGDQSGNDVAPGGGRPLWPTLFLTDLTVNGPNSRKGDWQQGGTGIPPTRVCGTWKAAVRTVDKTKTPNTVTVTPDQDPSKNDWTLGSGSDAPPQGFGALANEGYGAEVVWKVSELKLVQGHSYRAQFIVHDGDQNKTGGDCGEACTTVQFQQTLAVDEPGATSFQLLQNTPNPFRVSTTIRYSLTERSRVRLVIVDLVGREIASLVQDTREGGDYAVVWNGAMSSGERARPGMYFYRLDASGVRTGDRQLMRKMIMLK